jgi:GlpG protein
MRSIGQLESEANARTFSDYLYVQGIENDLEAEKDGSWTVWIRAEDELEHAKTELAAFRANPADPKFKSTARAADDLKEKKRREQAEYEMRLKQRRHLFRPLTGYGFGPVTFALIFISVAVYLLHHLVYQGDNQAVMKLFITDFTFDGQYIKCRPGLFEIRHGEIWRLITPIFLHFSILHILFNMIWLRDLGSMIEGRQSSWLLVIMVLVIAALSNTAQFFVAGPEFGGMSGVVYGLFGYVWIRGKLDPGSGLILHSTTVTMMIVWFFLCLTGYVGNIANTVHAVGLVVGMAWGWLSSLKYR